MLQACQVSCTIIFMHLFKHQSEAIKRFKNKSGAILFEMGLGKTRTAIELFKESDSLVCLVVAPISLLEAAWREDIKKFSDIPCCNIRKGEEPLKGKHFLLVNYEYLLSEKKLNELLKLCPQDSMIVIDESSRMKNHKSKITKLLLNLRDKFKYRYVMSGCPAPNSELEYYAQMEFIQPGIFGSSFFKFRNTFFHLSRGKQVMQGKFVPPDTMQKLFMSGWKYKITEYNRKRLMGIISPYCDVRKKVDCLDLPEEIDEIREVEMTKEQSKIYNDMKRHLISEIKGRSIIAQVVLAKLQKLREATSGFMYDDTGVAHEIEGGNPKLKELIDVIEEAGEQPVIIWATFKYEIIKIIEKLKEIAPTGALYSDGGNRDEVVQDFLNGKIRYLVAHPKSGAHGLRMVNCSLQIFFSMDFSFESFIQAKARIHRLGQTKTCVYIHLNCNNSIDEQILEVLKRKGDMQELLSSLK